MLQSCLCFFCAHVTMHKAESKEDVGQSKYTFKEEKLAAGHDWTNTCDRDCQNM